MAGELKMEKMRGGSTRPAVLSGHIGREAKTVGAWRQKERETDGERQFLSWQITVVIPAFSFDVSLLPGPLSNYSYCLIVVVIGLCQLSVTSRRCIWNRHHCTERLLGQRELFEVPFMRT